jgi:phospholipid/cholesterol/gamma-HCH transport system substrate-binding protein
MYSDLRESMDNIRNITESIKSLIGTGEGQVQTAGDKLKRDLDKLADTLDKFNHNLDQVADLTGRVGRGEGTIGKLMTDDTIARNVSDITEDAGNFVRTITHLQTILGIREEYQWFSHAFKTYLSLKLQPRPDKYYLIELVDDPRGNRTYEHTLTWTQVGNGPPQPVNTDTWTRTPAFRVTFQFAKRITLYDTFGFTGRIGVKESSGGVGVDIDAWKQRLVLSLDLFDFQAEDNPRLKIMGAIEVFRHAWLIGGVDDILNSTINTPSTEVKPGAAVTCGPSTPNSWCAYGREYFFGAQLSFNDDDLRALLTIGGSALGAAAASPR